MAKITASDIQALGFTKEIFGQTTDLAFVTLINDVIAEQSAILEGLTGDAYDSTTAPTSTYVKRAEKCLVAAEMVQLRINRILSDVIGAGQEIDVTHEGAQKKAYADEAARLITRLGGDSDYAGGVLETSHFEEDDA